MAKVQFLGGNRIIMRYFQLVLFLIVLQSCKQNKDNFDVNESQLSNVQIIESSNDSIINTISSFYTSYISENVKDIVDKNYLKELKNKYLAKNLIVKLEKRELDYDPLVNAQDYNIDWLNNIEITKDKSKLDTYKVYINDNNVETDISLVIKKERNQYKIYDINNLPNEITKSEIIESYIEMDITGTWKKICEENETSLQAFDSSHGYLDIYMQNDYARVSVDINNNSDIKYSVLTGITRHNRFVNWIDISHDSIICKIKFADENSIEIEWFGFYNNKTKKREMIKNPFVNEPDNHSVSLNKCE